MRASRTTKTNPKWETVYIYYSKYVNHNHLHKDSGSPPGCFWKKAQRNGLLQPFLADKRFSICHNSDYSTWKIDIFGICELHSFFRRLGFIDVLLLISNIFWGQVTILGKLERTLDWFNLCLHCLDKNSGISIGFFKRVISNVICMVI